MPQLPFLFAPGNRWRWVSLNGPDAADFLHRLTTVSISTLRVGGGAEGFFLTAQGRIRSRFTLWRLGPESFGFEVDSGEDGRWLNELLAVIEQYTFAERFTLKTEPWTTLWNLGGAVEGLAPLETRELSPGARACRHEDSAFGVAWTALWAAPGATLDAWLGGIARPPEAQASAWIEHRRIEALSPALDRELTPERNPLEIGLRAGIADNKGCYPGQEVIEKIISLGSPARRLSLLKADEAPPSEKGLKIFGPDSREIGQVTSLAPDGRGGALALGLVSKAQAQESAAVRIGATAEAATAARILKVAPYA